MFSGKAFKVLAVLLLIVSFASASNSMSHTVNSQPVIQGIAQVHDLGNVTSPQYCLLVSNKDGYVCQPQAFQQVPIQVVGIGNIHTANAKPATPPPSRASPQLAQARNAILSVERQVAMENEREHVLEARQAWANLHNECVAGVCPQ